MVFIEQIIRIFIVYFNERNIKLVLVLRSSNLELFENIAQDSGDDPSFCPLFASAHGVRLTAAGLSICENSAIVPVKTIVNHRLSNNFKNLLLTCPLSESLFETEFMMVSRIRHFVSGCIKSYYLLSVDRVA